MEPRYVVLLIGMIMLAGCAAGVQEEKAAEEMPAAEAPLNETEIPEEQPEPVQEQEEQPPQEAAEGNGYSADFASLAAMDIPLECDITYTYKGKEIQARMYMQGAERLRVESPAGMTQCARTITVIRDTKQYVGCEGKMIMPSCDWFKSSYDTSKPGLASNFDFREVPASRIECRDWIFDDAKFRTEGTSCQLG